jgi:outer membrane protein OmpA-like peptidoglycan-associated protein
MSNKPVTSFIAALVILPVLSAAAQTTDQKPAIPSPEEIVQRLTTPPDKLPINMRGITIVKPQGGKASPKPQRPNIDLAVNFEFNSAQLTPDGELILDNLGRALKDPQLGASRFAIAGHTDAVGSANYNKTLSEQRAEAVRRYLIEHYGVAADHLTAKGFGLTQLLDPGNPKSAVNRRVEITNIGKAP